MRWASSLRGVLLAVAGGESAVVGTGSVDDRGEPGIGLDAGSDTDAGQEPDAGPDDAGPRDGGADAGPDDAGPPDAGTDGGRDDAGVDGGPTRDGGPDAMADGGGGCMVAGTYDLTADPMNPPTCSLVTATSCTAVQPTATDVELACGTLTGDCTLDSACVCTGSGTVSGISGTIRVDFPGLTVRATAVGTTCDFDIMRVP